jgi:hypothetical protein
MLLVGSVAAKAEVGTRDCGVAAGRGNDEGCMLAIGYLRPWLGAR